MDAPDILDLLERQGIVHWIEGGWGVDAPVGRETRHHGDLDIVFDLVDLELVMGGLGLAGFTKDHSARGEFQARFTLRNAAGLKVDLQPIQIDTHGNGWHQIGPAAWRSYPAAHLGHAGTIAGLTVKCISPQLQLDHHMGYELTDTDIHDLLLLGETYGLLLPPGLI